MESEKSILEIQLEKQYEHLEKLRRENGDHINITNCLRLINYLKRDIEEEKKRKDKEPTEKKIPPNPNTNTGKKRSKTKLSGRMTKITNISELDIESKTAHLGNLIECCPGTRRNRHFIPIGDLENIKTILENNSSKLFLYFLNLR